MHQTTAAMTENQNGDTKTYDIHENSNTEKVYNGAKNIL
jgi:hypothetical protein